MTLSGLAALRPASPLAGGRTFLGVEKSLGGRRWAERLSEGGERDALAIAQSNQLPELLGRVLAGRGVGPAEATAFLDPTIRSLMPDPDVLTDMAAAAARIADAIMDGEAIVVFGDYDVDGAASTALLARFLRYQGIDPRLYIPDRLFEGYGPNVDAVERLADEGAKLILTVDCGSTSIDALAAAKARGVDVVVIDHHQLGELPPATALVNPQRADDISGLGYLAAVGLVFMTIAAVNRVLRRRNWYGPSRSEPDLMAWLDLVALGTVCDVVPLTGLNRAFVVKGLLALQRGANVGLAALSRQAGLAGNPAPYHLSFMLGPRINAGGRIGDAGLGARLLATNDGEEAERIAQTLERLNRERQAIEASMLEEALAEAEAEIGRGEGPAILLSASPSYHAGVVGLVAARLKERFHRPSFALSIAANGIATGSGRSVAGVDLGRAVRAAVDQSIILKGGGHAMAAGLSLEANRIGELRAFLSERLSSETALARSGATLLLDGALSASGANLELLALLERAGPFGASHAEPIFAFPAHRIAYAEPVGGAHIRLSLAASDGAKLKGIAFRALGTPLGQALLERRRELMHLAGTLSLDQYQGRRQASLRLIDAAIPQ